METIETWDRELFLLINSAHSPFIDEVMHVISTRWVWIPAYIFVLYLLYKKYNLSGIYAVLLSVPVLIALTDAGSVYFFKNWFERYRPCHNEEIKDLVHLYHNRCGGQFGFVSSHAANFFGLATYLSLVFRLQYKKSWMIFFGCAILTAYSRIYLGVHYPADVIAGGFFGIVCGWVSFKLFTFIHLKLSKQ